MEYETVKQDAIEIIENPAYHNTFFGVCAKHVANYILDNPPTEVNFWCLDCKMFVRVITGDGDIVCEKCKLIITSTEAKSELGQKPVALTEVQKDTLKYVFEVVNNYPNCDGLLGTASARIRVAFPEVFYR